MSDRVNHTRTYDDIVDGIQEYTKEIEEFEERVDQYRHVVEAHRKDKVSDDYLESAIGDVADRMKELDEYRMTARSNIEDVHRSLEASSEHEEYIAIMTEAELAYERLREQFSVGEPEGDDGLDALTAVYNDVEERHDETEDRVFEEDMYVEEVFGTTVADERWEQDDLLDEASRQQLEERAIAKKRQQNPNDMRLPTIVGNDYAGIDEAREAVRQSPPAGFTGAGSSTYTPPSSEELAERSQRVAEARERVKEKDTVRSIW